MDGDKVAQHRGMQPSPSPHRAAKVRDWGLVLLGRIRTNRDMQTFNERRHAAFNLMTVYTHKRIFIRMFLLQHNLGHGCPRGCPGGWDGPGSGGRDCRSKGDGEMWDTVSSFSYTLVDCIGKLTCTRKGTWKRRSVNYLFIPQRRSERQDKLCCSWVQFLPCIHPGAMQLCACLIAQSSSR